MAARAQETHPKSRKRRPAAGTFVRHTLQGLSLVAYLVLFLYVCWPYTASPDSEAVITGPDGREFPAHYAMELRTKEILPAETFLMLDPLVGTTAAIAARTPLRALAWAAAVALACLIVRRGFCSYICPLGTLIGICDATFGKLTRKRHCYTRGWWSHARHVFLVAILICAGFGLLASSFGAAMPILTRGLVFSLNRLHLGIAMGWHNVPPPGGGQAFAVWLLAGIFCLALLGRRFWCVHLCPSGALLSWISGLSVRERRVATDCVDCGKCVTACAFGAVNDDFSTDASRCTSCRECSRTCPVEAIAFTPRPRRGDPRGVVPKARGRPISRREFAGGLVSGLSVVAATGCLPPVGSSGHVPIRPPGSVPEDAFLRLCIRCGVCFRACPNSVLQPIGLAQGPGGLWTPQAVPRWSGCEPSCNSCGQVCPTGAVRPLPLEEKRAARMGRVDINKGTCLPWADRGECEMCAEECRAAGYNAIEFERVGVEVDDGGFPIEGTGRRAPVLLPDQCVGCGLCETRCHRINVLEKGLLNAGAIAVKAGPGREDRIAEGSYLALREAERRSRLSSSALGF